MSCPSSGVTKQNVDSLHARSRGKSLNAAPRPRPLPNLYHSLTHPTLCVYVRFAVCLTTPTYTTLGGRLLTGGSHTFFYEIRTFQNKNVWYITVLIRAVQNEKKCDFGLCLPQEVNVTVSEHTSIPTEISVSMPHTVCFAWGSAFSHTKSQSLLCMGGAR